MLILKNNKRSVIWQTVDMAAVSIIASNSQLRQVFQMQGVEIRDYDVSLQNLRSPPYRILSPLGVLFLSILCLLTS